MYGILGNITNIDALQYTNDPLYSIYFIQSANEFYEYIPIEETSSSINTLYDQEVKDNLLNVTLDNGLYYWRIKSYHKEGYWQEWSSLYNFTIDFA